MHPNENSFPGMLVRDESSLLITYSFFMSRYNESILSDMRCRRLQRFLSYHFDATIYHAEAEKN
jgi:hypothetical protein